MINLKKGFTLIELLVAVLIIGILAAIALPRYNKAVERSRATEVEILFNAMIKAYNVAALNGTFNSSFSSLDLTFPIESILLPTDGAFGECAYFKGKHVQLCMLIDLHGERFSVSHRKSADQGPYGDYWFLNYFYSAPQKGYRYYCVVGPNSEWAKEICKSLGFEQRSDAYSFGYGRTSFVKP